VQCYRPKHFTLCTPSSAISNEHTQSHYTMRSIIKIKEEDIWPRWSIRCVPSCNFRIAFIRCDPLTLIRDLLISRANRYHVRLTLTDSTRLKFAWLPVSCICREYDMLISWPLPLTFKLAYETGKLRVFFRLLDFSLLNERQERERRNRRETDTQVKSP